ncbi:MAG: putative glycosyltransferase YibD [Rhizobium sp.]|nr:putative glycosyltransferase YibD [Rhizobium sp.]
MTKPEFSVIIPVYNRTDLLKRAMGSVLYQEFVDLEVLVIDDGSVDDIKSIVDSFSDIRIHYHRQSNQGASAARNAGIDRATGTYVAFLDSDDVFLPHHLAVMHAMLRNAPGSVAYCPIIATRGIHGNFIKPPRAIASSEDMATYLMCDRGFVQTSGVCLSRETAKAIRYRDDAKFGDDTDFAVRLHLAGYPFVMADAPGVVWSDDLDHERLSDIRQPLGELQWLEDLRPDIPPRAYHGYKGWHQAKSLMQTAPFRALTLYFRAALRGAYSPRFAMVVLMQIVVPNHYYRVLSDFWIRRRTRKRENRGATKLSDIAGDRVSDSQVRRPS